MSHIFSKLYIPLKLILILSIILVTVVSITFMDKHLPVISGVSWTDSVIVAGKTLIRKVHMDELRSEINTTEADLGLSQTSWTDPTIIPSQTFIKAVHFTELRTALGTIFSTIEEAAPTWTDSDLTDIAVRKVHLAELRTETESAQTTITGQECCGGGSCPKTVGTDCTGACKSCDGTDLDCQFTADGQDYQTECNGIDCSVAGYYDAWTGGTCYYKADVSAGNNNCKGDGTCRDAADDCPGQGQGDTTGTSRSSCRTEVGCSGTTGPSLGYVSDGSDTYSDCDGLSCSGYYIQTGTEGPVSTETCYDRADEPAGTHNCEGDGTCRDAADDCPSNSADTYKYNCASCKYISASNCTGTTLGSCSNYGSGTSCGTCYACDGSGNCLAQTTSWGGGASYGCSGSNKRCYSGTCKTCGGVFWDNRCYRESGSGETCTSKCSSYGGGYNNCSAKDNSACDLCHQFHPGRACTYRDNPSVPLTTNAPECWYVNSYYSTCGSSPGPGYYRFCSCNY